MELNMIKQALTPIGAALCKVIAGCAFYAHLALSPIKMYQYRITILAALTIIWFSPLRAQTVTEAWVQSDANGYPYGSMIAMDSQENVVVTGWRFGSYIVTKKYDPEGNVLWEQHYSVPNHQAVATWVLVDPFDNIVITGYPQTFSSNPVEVGLLTIKYDNEGNLLWSDTYSGTWALAIRGISDTDGNIYVAGRAWFGTYDFVTIKYAPDGTRLWVDTFDQNSGFHTPNSMDLDSQGNLIINGAGNSGGFITVLYNMAGVRQWVIEGLGNRTGWVQLSGDGFFYLTGSFYDVHTSNDIWLLKYDLSGNLVWERNYDFGVTSEYGTRLALDSQGNIIVTGIQSVPSDWITIKVDPQGNLLWSNVYAEHPSWDEVPGFIAIGPDDETYITGAGGPCPPAGCSYRSMVTLRYNSDGSNPWTATYYATSQRGVGLSLASDNSVYVAGDYMLTIIKYSQTETSVPGNENAGVALEFALSQNYPNPFNSMTVIPFALKETVHTRLAVYNVLGQQVAVLVNGVMAAGEHRAMLNGRDLASGVYFYRLEAGSFIQARKVVLLK